MDVAASEVPSDSWSCPQCTLIQPRSTPICSACEYLNEALVDAAAASSSAPPSLSIEELEAQELEQDARATSSGAAKKRLPSLEDGGKHTNDYELLRRCILSRRWSQSDAHDRAAQASIDELSDSQVLALFRKNVKDFDSMMDRRGEQRISALITSTYRSGLPLYNEMPAVKRHMRDAMRYICHAANGHIPAEAARKQLSRVADAFRACQAEQGRVIDAVYGTLKGRDRGLREQVLAVVHEQQERVLELVVNHLNPDAWKVDDGTPAKQVSSERMNMNECTAGD